MIQQFHSRVYIWGKQNHYLKVISVLLCSVQHYSQVWKQPKCPLTGEWIKRWDIYIFLYREKEVCDIYTQWNIIQPQKRRKSCHLWQHGWTWRAYTKRKKPDRKTLDGITHLWNLKKKKKSQTCTEYKGGSQRLRVEDTGRICKRVQTFIRR